MTVFARLLLAAVLLAACGAPAASSLVAATASPLGSPTAADTREFSMQVSGLI